MRYRTNFPIFFWFMNNLGYRNLARKNLENGIKVLIFVLKKERKKENYDCGQLFRV